MIILFLSILDYFVFPIWKRAVKYLSTVTEKNTNNVQLVSESMKASFLYKPCQYSWLKVMFNLKLIIDNISDLYVKSYLKKITLSSMCDTTITFFIHVDLIIGLNFSSFHCNVINPHPCHGLMIHREYQLLWEPGLGHVTCLGQWNVNRNMKFMYTFWLALLSLTIPFKIAWVATALPSWASECGTWSIAAWIDLHTYEEVTNSYYCMPGSLCVSLLYNILWHWLIFPHYRWWILLQLQSELFTLCS